MSQPFISSCAQDNQIENAKKDAIDSAALSFLQLFMEKNSNRVFDLLSKEAQKNFTREQLASQVALIQQFEPKNLAVQHTYLLHLTGESPGRLVCASDLSKADGWVSVSAVSLPEQAYVAISADTRNNELGITVWLVPEQQSWKVQSFWMNASTLGDKDPTQVWKLASAQKLRGHNFNAALLYAAAAQISNRGPDFQLGITQSISEDMAHLVLPPELQGQPPFLWKTGKITYKVLQVGPIAIAGKVYVIINHEVEPWTTNSQVDGWNNNLISYFKKSFPEYSDVFAGVVARAHERGTNRGYGTVDAPSDSK